MCSPTRNFVTLVVHTDEGIYGLGDATLNGREMAVVSYLQEHVIPCLTGKILSIRKIRGSFYTKELIGNAVR